MGSSKQISGGEVIQIILLLQQGGLFWMLPVMLIHTNGTAGLVSCIPGLAAGILILLVCTFWRKHCEELTFPQSLEKLLGNSIGKMAGTLFVCLYLLFALVCLGCFIEVLHTQLLPETPRALLLLPVFILAGWLSRNGLEDIARMTPFAVLAYILLIALVFTGAIGSFMPEQLLPLQNNSTRTISGSSFPPKTNGFTDGPPPFFGDTIQSRQKLKSAAQEAALLQLVPQTVPDETARLNGSALYKS